jgi:hypothetical protein
MHATFPAHLFSILINSNTYLEMSSMLAGNREQASVEDLCSRGSLLESQLWLSGCPGFFAPFYPTV